MKLRKIPQTFLILVAMGSACAYAKKVKAPKYEQTRQLTQEQTALVERAVTREKVLIKEIQQRTPLVETYIQDTRPDAKLYEVPIDDHYMLSRVDFSKVFVDRNYSPREQSRQQGFFKNSLASITGLTRALRLDRSYVYNPTGFMDMMFIDPSSFDTQHYAFSYVRPEFLGSVRTAVFDVHPKPGAKGAHMGRFYGRIWIEDQGGNVVRFNGTYTGPTSEDDSRHFFHFDSWRMNVQPDVWLPVAIYVEESHLEGEKNEGLKAQTHFWGYSLKLPTRDSENVSVKVDNAEDKSDDSQDVGPLQASRMWITQAENNVIDRLVEAGLVAPLSQGGYEDKVLGQIVVNLVVPNNLAFTDQIHCRVLLTDTVEATTVGNTILVSKGLIDSLPSEEAIASVVAMELAHIALGHHIDTRYAFNDRLLFPDEATFQRIDMYHTDVDNATAAKKAVEYLQASMYKDRMGNAGLFYAQLQQRGQELKSLNTPKLGDSLLKPDGTPWMSELEHMAPALNWDDLNQTAALPLGSWLKVDPWDDKVHMLDAKRYSPMNARDKMPFEVTPIFFKLQRYDLASAQPVAAPAGDQGAAQPAAAPAGDPGASQPAAAPAADQGTAQPNAAQPNAAQPSAAQPDSSQPATAPAADQAPTQGSAKAQIPQ